MLVVYLISPLAKVYGTSLCVCVCELVDKYKFMYSIVSDPFIL